MEPLCIMFDDCVNDFTTKSLINREETCIMRCVDKNLKSSAWLMAGRRDHGQGDKRRGRDFSKEAGTYSHKLLHLLPLHAGSELVFKI
jgi:hypothetical protein